jgi:hypothetical protein
VLGAVELEPAPRTERIATYDHTGRPCAVICAAGPGSDEVSVSLDLPAPKATPTPEPGAIVIRRSKGGPPIESAEPRRAPLRAPPPDVFLARVDRIVVVRDADGGAWVLLRSSSLWRRARATSVEFAESTPAKLVLADTVTVLCVVADVALAPLELVGLILCPFCLGEPR